MTETSGYSYPRIEPSDKAYYIRLAEEPEKRRLVRELVVPRLGGKGFVVERGQILRVICSEGPQVADFNAFNRDDHKEWFWSGRTRLLQGAHLSVGDRLWSTPPRMRPMFTIIADTVEHRPLPGNARSHDVMYTRCNERLYELTQGKSQAPNCNTNLTNAAAEFGVPPEYVHDAFNIFMTTGLGADGRFFYLDPDAKKGDFVELVAEMDCVVALSACPGNSSGPEKRPLGVQIYQPLLSRP
ncbi:MAG TPA: urea carboxylase-associated family protein [Stellaceae bacterium]|nr:urea carboxylase-associated family protein [Stellaceae bacterium]